MNTHTVIEGLEKESASYYIWMFQILLRSVIIWYFEYFTPKTLHWLSQSAHNQLIPASIPGQGETVGRVS